MQCFHHFSQGFLRRQILSVYPGLAQIGTISPYVIPIYCTYLRYKIEYQKCHFSLLSRSRPINISFTFYQERFMVIRMRIGMYKHWTECARDDSFARLHCFIAMIKRHGNQIYRRIICLLYHLLIFT